MTTDKGTWLTLGGLIMLSGMAAFVGFRLVSLDNRIAVLFPREERMQTLKQTVTTADNQTIEVSTVRLDGESLADWIARHVAAVTAVKAIGS